MVRSRSSKNDNTTMIISHSLLSQGTETFKATKKPSYVSNQVRNIQVNSSHTQCLLRLCLCMLGH